MRGNEVRTLSTDFIRGQTDGCRSSLPLMQIYSTISQLYQPGSPKLELFKSDVDDVSLVYGYMFPQPRLDSPGVKVLVHSPSNAG